MLVGLPRFYDRLEPHHLAGGMPLLGDGLLAGAVGGCWASRIDAELLRVLLCTLGGPVDHGRHHERNVGRGRRRPTQRCQRDLVRRRMMHPGPVGTIGQRQSMWERGQ